MKPQSAKAKGRYKHAKSAMDYLEQRLDKSGDCWLWTGAVDKNGYGQCHAAKHAQELKVTRSHQLAYVVWVGPIPEEKIVCHHCDIPACCNPEHLYAGTWRSNVQDCLKRGRYRNGAKRKVDYNEVVNYHGKLPCKDVATIFNVSYSLICQIWRKHGLTGRNF